MSTVLCWHDYMKMVHRKDANILIWSDCLHDKHRVNSELWAIDTSSAGLWACAAFVALTHLCSDYGTISSLQHCWVATVVAHVTYPVCLPLLAHHPLHGLHALCSLQVSLQASLYAFISSEGFYDGSISSPFWWMSSLIPTHVVTLCSPWSILSWMRDRHDLYGQENSSYPVWHTHLHFLFVAVCERQIHIEKAHSRNAVIASPRAQEKTGCRNVVLP